MRNHVLMKRSYLPCHLCHPILALTAPRYRTQLRGADKARDERADGGAFGIQNRDGGPSVSSLAKCCQSGRPLKA